MNVDTGQIYWNEEDVKKALARGENLKVMSQAELDRLLNHELRDMEVEQALKLEASRREPLVEGKTKVGTRSACVPGHFKVRR